MKKISKRLLSLVMAVFMVVSMLPASVFAADDATAALVMIDGTAYESLTAAIAAANDMEAQEVTVDIYGKTEYTADTESLIGSYTTINFVGHTDTAEISITRDGSAGYISGENSTKTVNFTDLTLSKATGAFANDAGFMNVYFSVYRVAEVSYTNCVFPDGACAAGCPTAYTGCTFANDNDSNYNLWVYDNAECVVTNCTFEGIRGAKMYAEGETDPNNSLTITGSTFADTVTKKPAIVLTYGESVTLEGNTYSATGVFELDHEGAPNGTAVTADITDIACRNDNYADCGVLVDGKIYTTVTDAAAVAAEGSTVTLMYDATETVELAEGVILNKNGYAAANVTVAEPGVTGLSGSGTEEDPYRINNLEELKWFRDDVNAGNTYAGQYVKLTADIDLSSVDSWTPIGDMDADKIAFRGTFDGDNHTISNLCIWAEDTGLGFFGRTGSFSESEKAVVKNIKFHNVDVGAAITDHWTNGHGDYVGGVIANASGNTVISNVHLTGYVYVVGCGYVGGIVGHGYPDIDNCSVAAEDGSYVHAGYWCAGGIIGYAGEGGTPISNCSVSGLNVWSGYGAAAAVAGLLQDGNTLTNVSAKDVEVTSGSDYIMGYIAGNGEASTMTNVTMEGVTATANGKVITPTDAVASAGGKTYFSLAEAIDAAQEGDTVTLLRDVTVTGTIVVDKDIVLDLNEKTITNVGGSGNHTFRVAANMTVKNGTIDNTAGGYCFIVGYNTPEAGNLTVESGSYHGNTTVISVTYGTVNVKGGYFEATPFQGEHTFTLNCVDRFYDAGQAVVSVSGGRFYKFNPFNNAAEGTGTNFCAPGYTAVDNGDGTYTAAKLPEAIVTVMGKQTLTDYDVWDGSTLSEGVGEKPVEVVLNFKAEDTLEDCLAGGYAEYLTDFYITVEGLAEGSVMGTNSYLAGNYGTYGWIVIPLDNTTVENGVAYPVVAAYDPTLNYKDICSSVKDFTAAIHIDQAILDANPDMTVTLELRMTNPEDASDVLLIGEPAVYDAEALRNGAVAQNKQTNELYSTVSDALNAAAEGETVSLLRDTEETEIVVRRGTTLDLNGFALTVTDAAAPYTTSYIIDSSEGEGMLKVAQENISLNSANKQLPVWSAEGCRFVTVEFAQSAKLKDNGDAYFRFYIKGDDADCRLAQELADGGEDNGVSIEVLLTWKDAQGAETSRYFVFSDALVQDYAADWLGNEFRLTVTGLDNITDLQLAATAISVANEEAEVIVQGEAKTPA